jgi:hypothetical protein
VEINNLTIWTKNRNNYYFNTFKLYITTNATIIAIVTIYNKREVTYSTNNIIYTISINNLIINKQCINKG